MDKQILQHTSLKMLYFYRQQVTAVFHHTMFGLENHPQHCCAWLSLACNFTENAHPNVPDELPRFARDAVLYAESLLDSVMGGLEGLINILDSEGGYGSLDKKLLPEQAAMCLNHVAKTGVPATMSTNGDVEFPRPGFESEPLNREKIKMLEAAMQRLTSLCSVVNQMEPLRVLNHMFLPREYLRQRVVKNFREFLANVIIVDGGLQRLSVAEAQLQRHMSIVHLVEQHVQLDLTRGLREVLLTESFAHPMRNFQPEDREVGIGGEVVCTIADWYIENVLLTDAKVCGGVLFSPLDKCFKSTRPIGQIPAGSVTNLAELKAFVRIFGPYGVDKLCGSVQSQLKKLLGLLQTSLHTNKETLGSLAAGNFSRTTQSRCRRDTKFLQVIELETVMTNCLLVGHLLSMWSLLVEATGQVLQSNTPLLFSLFSDFTKHAPVSVPETPNLRKMKSVASQVGAVGQDGDAIMLQNILADMEGTPSEQSWDLAPFLFVACMASEVWKSTSFNVYTGGFTTNVYCLSRCIKGIIVASEWVRAERKELQKQGQLSEPRSKSSINQETAPRLSAGTQGDLEARIKSAFEKFLQNSVAAVLEAWDDAHRFGFYFLTFQKVCVCLQ
jgi:NCK-associated protein 1